MLLSYFSSFVPQRVLKGSVNYCKQHVVVEIKTRGHFKICGRFIWPPGSNVPIDANNHRRSRDADGGARGGAGRGALLKELALR